MMTEDQEHELSDLREQLAAADDKLRSLEILHDVQQLLLNKNVVRITLPAGQEIR
jgi:hypothetical protein